MSDSDKFLHLTAIMSEFRQRIKFELKKKKMTRHTYPLDSLASDRALRSTSSLLRRLVSQLPTFTNQKQKKYLFRSIFTITSLDHRSVTLPGVLTMRCWLDLVA